MFYADLFCAILIYRAIISGGGSGCGSSSGSVISSGGGGISSSSSSYIVPVKVKITRSLFTQIHWM